MVISLGRQIKSFIIRTVVLHWGRSKRRKTLLYCKLYVVSYNQKEEKSAWVNRKMSVPESAAHLQTLIVRLFTGRERERQSLKNNRLTDNWWIQTPNAVSTCSAVHCLLIDCAKRDALALRSSSRKCQWNAKQMKTNGTSVVFCSL